MSQRGGEDSGTSNPERPSRSSFFAELRKRQVFQAAVAYAVVAWGITEILDEVISRFGGAEWLATLVVILFVVGFPVAMFLAWVFDWTPEGIRREEPWTASGWLSIVVAAVFLIASTAGLFWLINPAGVAHLEKVGIAVLPCRYRGEESEAFRAEGVAEVLNRRLAHLEQLHVPSYRSMLQLSAQRLETAELAARAGVEWLVECRLSQAGPAWQMDTYLVNVAQDESQTVTTIEGSVEELFEALESITLSLLAELEILPTESTRIQWSIQATNHARSYDAFLQGEQAMRLSTPEGFRQAREHFRNAQDGPGFELARVREADALMALLEIDPPPTQRERAAALRAVSLMLDTVKAKGDLPPEWYAAHMRLAMLTAHLAEGALPAEDQMRPWFERAIEIRPSYSEPYYLLGEFLQDLGRGRESREILEQALALDPRP